MAKPACARCRLLRTAVLALLCGLAGGFGADALGWSSNGSMTATFLAALLPVLGYARQNRIG